MKEFASNEKNEQQESALNCSLQECLQKCLVFKALWKELQGVSKSSGLCIFFLFFAFYTQVFAKRKDIGQVSFIFSTSFFKKFTSCLISLAGNF